MRASRLPAGHRATRQRSSNTEQYANNRIESDHARLKARLRPMRGLKRDRSAQVVVAGHAFIQNLRRGHYALGTYARTHLRVAAAFDELTDALLKEIDRFHRTPQRDVPSPNAIDPPL